ISADVPLAISDDRTQISATFTPHFSGFYALKLTDETGLASTRLIEIRLTVDPVPIVKLMRPSVGIDPPYLTPTANVIISTEADDKQLYGIRSSFIEYRVGREGPVRILPLAFVPNVSATTLSALTGGPIATAIPPSGPVEVTRI